MLSTLKSTTSLVLCLSLAVPFAHAQEAAGEPVYPCVAPNGQAVTSDEGLVEAILSEQVVTEDTTADAAVPDCVVTDAIAATVDDRALLDEPEAEVPEVVELEEGDAADPVVADAVEAEPADEPTQDLVVSDSDVESVAGDQPENVPDEGEAEAVDEELVAADEAETVQEPAAEEPAAEEPDVAQDAPAVEEAEAAVEEPDAVEEAPAVEEAVAAPRGEVPDNVEVSSNDAGAIIITVTPDEDAAAEDTAPVENEVTQADEADAIGADVEVADNAAADSDADAEATVATDTGETADIDSDANEIVQADQADAIGADAGAQAPAAAAAASDDGDMADAPEAETEEVVAEDVRSASEEFETGVTGDDASPATQDVQDADTEASEDGDAGLSTFEKALLLGLGAAVVGSQLNNGDEVVSNSGDRVVVQRGDELRVLKNDDALLRQAGSQISTQTFDDGSTRTVVTREDGTQIVTVRSADGTVLRRARVLEDGSQVLLFDDTQEIVAVDFAALPDVEEEEVQTSRADIEALRAALTRSLLAQPDRTFSLNQVRDTREVRQLAPQVELDTITFASGSAAIDPSQAEELSVLGQIISDIVAQDPQSVFLIEGHTDAVGAAGYNLALSDRRAETVALALTQFFDVPPENLITQGYGEAQLKIDTQTDERLNRRAAVRNITQLLRE